MADSMTKDDFLRSVETTFKEALALVRKKNADYTGGSTDPFANFRTAEIAGVDPRRAVLLRLLEKVRRVSSLLGADPQVEDEPIGATLIDIVNLAALLRVWCDESRPTLS